MAVETRDKVIDGKKITVTQFPGRKALFYKVKLIKLFGSSIGAMLAQAKGLTAQVDMSVFAAAMDKLATTVDEGEFTRFVLELLQLTRIENVPITEASFDMEFAGNLLSMYKILWFTLEVNYGSFFGENGIGKILSALQPPPVPEKQPASSKPSKKS